MTLERYEALLEYWELYPPVNISAAAFLGIKKAPKNIPEMEPLEEFEL